MADDLARAALRRVWSLDLAIRDFLGLSENSWDFNAPGAMAGFGPIEGEEVGRVLARLLGELDTIAAAVHPPLISPPTDDSQKPADKSNSVEHQATNAEGDTPKRAAPDDPIEQKSLLQAHLVANSMGRWPDGTADGARALPQLHKC